MRVTTKTKRHKTSQFVVFRECQQIKIRVERRRRKGERKLWIWKRLRNSLLFLAAQLCLSLCDPMNCSLPGSSVHGILQARILEWVAISFTRWSSQPRDWTWVSCLGRWILYCSATKKFIKSSYRGTSLMVQGLGLCLPMQWVQVWSLARELRSHMPHGQGSLACWNLWGCKELDMT